MRPSIKYLAIYRHKGKYSVTIMCRFFEVSRSGCYDFVRRMDQAAFDQAPADKIAQCQASVGKTYGYRRVHIRLRNQGIYRNPKTVLRVMQKYGLLSEIRRRRKYRQMCDYLHKYPNLLNRQFKTERPNQKWVTDISYIHTGQGVICDLYDNNIAAYKTGTEQTIRLVLDTIKAAKRNPWSLRSCSDQGFQYTSKEYNKLTTEYGITPSMSRRGNCYEGLLPWV